MFRVTGIQDSVYKLWVKFIQNNGSLNAIALLEDHTYLDKDGSIVVANDSMNVVVGILKFWSLKDFAYLDMRVTLKDKI